LEEKAKQLPPHHKWNHHVQLTSNAPASIHCHPYCHCLSTWLNCLPGQLFGIASFAVIWHTICTFPISIPLCPIFPRFICLALGQRLYCPHIPLSDALEGLLLLSRPSLFLDYSNSPYCLAMSYCLVTSIGMDLIVSIVLTLYLPSLGG